MVLFDNWDARGRDKFQDSDLLGIPVHLTIRKCTFKEGKLELELRATFGSKSVTLEDALKTINTRFV